jgi:hypothetical protein
MHCNLSRKLLISPEFDGFTGGGADRQTKSGLQLL